jgi:hypothetical protein
MSHHYEMGREAMRGTGGGTPPGAGAVEAETYARMTGAAAQRYAYDGGDFHSTLARLRMANPAHTAPAYAAPLHAAAFAGANNALVPAEPSSTTTAAPAYISAPPAEGGTLRDAQVAPHDNSQMLQQIQDALAQHLSTATNFGADLLQEKNTISADIVLAWQWSGGSAGDDPAVYKADLAQLSQAFDNDRLDLAGNVFVHSVDVLSTFNSAPYPLAFTIDGIQGRELHHIHKTNGKGYTYLLPPGVRNGQETVHKLRDIDADQLIEHGNANTIQEAKSIVPLTGTSMVFVHPQSRLGQILKMNEEAITGAVDGLVPLSKEIPLYAVPWQQAKAVLTLYHDNVVSKLPATKFSELTARLERFDRADSRAGDRFGDAHDAPGLTRTEKDKTNASTHMAYARFRIRCINPDYLVA